MVLLLECSIQSPINPDSLFESFVGPNPFMFQKSDPDSLVTSQLPMSNGKFHFIEEPQPKCHLQEQTLIAVNM